MTRAFGSTAKSQGLVCEGEAMYSILYIIGAIVVIYVVLRVLGIA
jgi:hypothetical protein